MTKAESITKAIETIYADWKDDGQAVVAACIITGPLHMDMKDFLSECICCGGNWGGMLLSGVKRLRPEVWDAIPNDMGDRAWIDICCVLTLLDVVAENDE